MGRAPIRTSLEQMEFIEGREGILIPKIDMEELGPKEFLEFFRDTLRANMKAREGRDIGFYYTQASPSMDEFVIPGLEENPLVLMRYQQSGHSSTFGDNATHQILKEPDEPGGFDPFLKISHPINLEHLSIEPPDGESLTFYSRGRWPYPVVWFDGEDIEASRQDKQTLGHIATDFIELVS